MGDYFKLKKILIVLSIIICVGRIFKSISNGATIVDPTETTSGFNIQYDNNYETLQENYILMQERIILFYKNLLSGNTTQQDLAKTTLREIYNAIISSTPHKGVYFQALDTSDNYFVYHIYNPGLMVQANVPSMIYLRDIPLGGAYVFKDIPHLLQTRNSTYYSQYVDYRGVKTTKYDYEQTWIPIPMNGVYNSRWLSVFEDAGFIGSSEDYSQVLNSINSNLEETNQTLSNTYNYLTSQTHTDETSLPLQNITTSDDYTTQFTSFVDNLEDVFISDSTDSKTFTMTLPNNRSFNFSINPDMTNTLLTRIGGSSLINLIQVLWYIGIYGIIIFDFKRMINQIASGDILNITTDSSPIDNVVSASVSSTGALNTSTNHSGGDR